VQQGIELLADQQLWLQLGTIPKERGGVFGALGTLAMEFNMLSTRAKREFLVRRYLNDTNRAAHAPLNLLNPLFVH